MKKWPTIRFIALRLQCRCITGRCAYVCASLGGNLEVSVIEYAIPISLVSICVMLYWEMFVHHAGIDYRVAPLRNGAQPGYR